MSTRSDLCGGPQVGFYMSCVSRIGECRGKNGMDVERIKRAKLVAMCLLRR